MRSQEGSPRRIGILGLGCGTLAAYGKAGDTLRIYEINPLVLDIAHSEFTYLKDTPAKVEVAIGDGRLVLEAEPEPAIRHAGDGCLLRRLRAGPPDYGGGVPHLFPPPEAERDPGGEHLQQVPESGTGDGARRRTPSARRRWSTIGSRPKTSSFASRCSWTLIMDQATLAAHPELQHDAKVLEPRPSVPRVDGRLLQHVQHSEMTLPAGYSTYWRRMASRTWTNCFSARATRTANPGRLPSLASVSISWQVSAIASAPTWAALPFRAWAWLPKLLTVVRFQRASQENQPLGGIGAEDGQDFFDQVLRCPLRRVRARNREGSSSGRVIRQAWGGRPSRRLYNYRASLHRVNRHFAALQSKGSPRDRYSAA